jgi:hypothetical protein
MAPIWGSPSEMDAGQGVETGLEFLAQAALVCGGLPLGYGQVGQYSKIVQFRMEGTLIKSLIVGAVLGVVMCQCD